MLVIRMMPRIVGPHQVLCRASEAMKSAPVVRVIAVSVRFMVPPGRFRQDPAGRLTGRVRSLVPTVSVEPVNEDQE